MEAKLWTYGCSFTQGMWEFDFKGDSINNMGLKLKRMVFILIFMEDWLGRKW